MTANVKLGEQIFTGISKVSIPNADNLNEKVNFELENPNPIIQSVVNNITGMTLTTTVTGRDGQEKSGSAVIPQFILEAAKPNILGGFKADTKTDTDTIPVRIGADGKCYVAPANKITIIDNGDGTVNIDIS